MELDFHTARALLEWQVELGADEAIGDVPVNRYELPEVLAKPKAATPSPPPVAEEIDPVVVARQLAMHAGDLDALRAAMEGFDHCDLRRGARSFVFSDGNPAARVMIIGEAPGREEDQQGKPFVGPAGHLLDRMFEAIGMGRDHPDAGSAIYITNLIPWRPPQNREPTPEEIAMMLPFVKRHIELAAPEVLILMGNTACQGLLGRRGITRLRGHWTEVDGRPALPMFHPAFLLRNPMHKRETWADLLELQARLRGAG